MAQHSQSHDTNSTTKPMKMVLVAAAALIDTKSKKVLLAQRPPGKPMEGLWEFPGGKIEPNETPEAALIRELHEELGIQIKSTTDLTPLTFASHSYSNFHLLMPVYVCSEWSGEVVGREDQQLAWVSADKLRKYPMPDADIPLIPDLLRILS